eukprot:2992072-Amphidinium_carterae.1
MKSNGGIHISLILRSEEQSQPSHRGGNGPLRVDAPVVSARGGHHALQGLRLFTTQSELCRTERSVELDV